MRILPFMKWRFVAAAFSVVAITVAIGSISTRSLNWGLDFTGGVSVELVYEESVNLSDLRQEVADLGYLGAVVVSFGSDRDVLVRLPEGYTNDDGQTLVQSLRAQTDQDIELAYLGFVGPQVGEELREQGGLAMLLALGLVMLYVGFRFQFKFALGAVVALAHDVLFTLGFFSLTGLEFDLTVLAALLAVVGYSLNDTIVVADRIRENFRKVRRSTPSEVLDISLSETLGRTVVTSLTTLLVLAALALFGGEMIYGFAVALLVGVAVGTYSSIYVSATTLLALGVTKEDVAIPVKEGLEQDDRLP
ncbi:protein translocase subunit SecF [Luminiphilus syltensis]|nr:protein translocase subunit SecF [Luminiphilus syltensis]